MFSKDVLRIDAAQVTTEIEHALKSQVFTTLRRRGIVVGLSGGIDSSVVTALARGRSGRSACWSLLMPERDSASESAVAGPTAAPDSSASRRCSKSSATILDAAGCYARQDEAIRTVFPEYGDGYRCKITLPSILDGDRLNVSELTIETPVGRAEDVAHVRRRVPADRRGDELQAARPQDDGVLPRRSAELRRRRHAEPPRVRPGLLREAGRRRRRRQADRAPLQVAGLRARRVPRRARRDPPPAADDRHVLAAADAGGVLLRAALRQDGPLPLRAQPRACRRSKSRRRSV